MTRTVAVGLRTEIEHRHDSGQTVREIATAMALTYNAVWQALRRTDRIVLPQTLVVGRLQFLVRKGLIP